MVLPATVRSEVDEALRERGDGEIDRAVPVSGGCINNGLRLETRMGRTRFLKWNGASPPGMFAAEMDGLEALRRAADDVEASCRPVVPEPMAHGEGQDAAAWLLMEWVPSAPPADDSDERLGRGLALLHASGTTAAPEPVSARSFGWHRDNWIGSLPQSNRSHASWPVFWRDERIGPQLAVARDAGHLRSAVMDRLVASVLAALEGVDTPALLHGDLWSGNTYPTSGGAPALIDPAVHRGDGEVDLAMTELFGGFGDSFYAAYREARGISAEYGSHRRDLYQLYYLLVHVNLFGEGYVARTLRAAERVVSAVG